MEFTINISSVKKRFIVVSLVSEQRDRDRQKPATSSSLLCDVWRWKAAGGDTLTQMFHFISSPSCRVLYKPECSWFWQSLACMVAQCLNIDSSSIHSGGRLNNVLLLPGRYWAPAACLTACMCAPPGTWPSCHHPPSTHIYIHTHTHTQPPPPSSSSSSSGQATKPGDKVLSSGSMDSFFKKPPSVNH